MNYFKDIYKYREMIVSLVSRELRGRYKGSVLGFLWTFINPLLQLMVYTMVFSVILRSGIDKYYIFLFVALVPWMFFSTSVNGGASSIIASGEMVKKIYFPREILPISYVTACFVNMLLSFLVVFAVLLLSGFGVNVWALLFLPLIFVVEYILCLGIALLCSCLSVYCRDLIHILGIVTMAWQFITPVMYNIDIVPEKLYPIFFANPMTSVITAYRDILYYKQIPEMATLLHAAVFGMVILLIGAVVFHHLQKGFAEEM